MFSCVFFFNDTATTEIYTLSLHDALPISLRHLAARRGGGEGPRGARGRRRPPAQSKRRGLRAQGELRPAGTPPRSEEHTSELQSRQYLVCRLLLEKKK